MVTQACVSRGDFKRLNGRGEPELHGRGCSTAKRRMKNRFFLIWFCWVMFTVLPPSESINLEQQRRTSQRFYPHSNWTESLLTWSTWSSQQLNHWHMVNNLQVELNYINSKLSEFVKKTGPSHFTFSTNFDQFDSLRSGAEIPLTNCFNLPCLGIRGGQQLVCF